MCQHQCVNSLSVFWIWSSFPLLWGIGKGDAILLQELGQLVNFILHVGAFRMITLTVVCALAHFSFVLLLLGVLLGTLRLLWRLVLVSLLLRWIFSFLLAFLIHPQISTNQSLVFGRFDGAHNHQFILFLCERFHEICKARHFPGSSCQLCGMEGRNKHWVVRTNLLEYGQD